MKIELKLVTKNELELLMKWRMSEDVSRYMNTVNLTMESQKIWFEEGLKDPSQIRWVVWADGVPIGYMSYVDIDYKNKRCCGPSWFIGERGHLDLRQVIELFNGCCKFAFDVLGMNKIYGEIMTENKSVVRLVQMTCMELEGERKEFLMKDGVAKDMTLVGVTKSSWDNQNIICDNVTVEYDHKKIENDKIII